VLSGGLRSPSPVKLLIYKESYDRALDKKGFLAGTNHRENDMRSVTWNVRSLHRKGALKAVARELRKYRLDLPGSQDVRWEKGGTERAGDYKFFYGEGNGDHHIGTG
jgi:hypothetical protein